MKKKKKVVFINVVCNGSTGRIMCDIAKEAKNNGYETYCFYGRGVANKELNCIKIDNKLSILFHVLISRFGFNGHGSYFATKKLIKRLKEINPDIIHLHNIHGYYLNLKVLFNYLTNEYKGKIIWTLHDCWAFTGHCSYFTLVSCNKWQKECFSCPRLGIYPKEYIDTTNKEFYLKKRLFTNLNNVTLITPSNWLKSLVERSYLNKYPITTINNGINLNIFKRIIDFNILKKYDIPKNKKILLGVANIWEERKGLNIFLDLAKIIKEDEIIVLVGLNDKQKKSLPQNIIGITRTDNQTDLAKLYSLAKVFINPSFEETFSLVTIEAMACGTPVVVCDMSAPKELINAQVGLAVSKYTAADYYKAYKTLEKKNLDSSLISEYVEKFANDKMISKNLKIYEEE